MKMHPKENAPKPPTILTIAAALACLALFFAPHAFGVVPAPDGGYPGFNTAEGQSALFSLTTGVANTAVGWFSLKGNAEGSFNTATGAGTLPLNTGDENTATGAGALLSNTIGFENTANGAFALFSNTEGADNTAVGWKALFNNTTGNNNVANGFQALFSNTDGSGNTATGHSALATNSTGSSNTANGFQALYSNTTGFGNTANGAGALYSNTTGLGNTANGNSALANNITGAGNTALGRFAGFGVTTADNVTAIATGGANVSNSCFIGRIRGVTTAQNDAIPVLIDSFGQLGTASSSRRFKKEIRPMDKASQSILALKPVSFRYKSHPAGAGPQFGLIAEEVAEVNPDLIVRDDKGEIYTVRYDAVNAMLLNEFLKDHKRVEEQQVCITELNSRVANEERIIAQQQNGMEVLTAQLKEQAARIEKVSARLEVSNPASKLVINCP
jgi:trimeric autotransporter adhesin